VVRDERLGRDRPFVELVHAGDRLRARESRVEERGVHTGTCDEPVRPRTNLHDHPTAISEFDPEDLR